MQNYRDIDYDSFPVPDLTLDKHWILLPRAIWLEKRKAMDAALEARRLAELPPDHQIILVPADPTYSPEHVELWPVINLAVIEVLKRHEAIHHEVQLAVGKAVDEYRGWRNPYPASINYPDRPMTRKRSEPRTN